MTAISRKELVTDSAIALVATQGMRGLTHRGVDEFAGIPIGSASNVFRTRNALLSGIADRVALLVAHEANHARANEKTATDYCVQFLEQNRHPMRALLLFSLDPALPTDVAATTTKTLARVIATIAELAGISVSSAKGVLGIMMVQVGQGNYNRAEIDGALRRRWA